jgi:predicted ATPase
MAYWHMQLHPNDLNWEREEELLQKTNLIGVKSNDIIILKVFEDKLNIGDIILIRRYNQPIALVEVISEFEDSFRVIQDIEDNNAIKDDDYSKLDWFRYRRKIKILSFIADSKCNLLKSNKFLVKAMKGKEVYKYIQNIHKKISPSFFKNQKGLKLNKIYIQKYKIFNEFNLNFNETITVIAGINGSGKTTLLEYIYNFSSYILDKDNDKSSIEFEMYKENNKKQNTETLNYTNYFENEYSKNEKISKKSLQAEYFERNIIYFPTGTDITDLKVFIAEYVKETMHKENLRPSDVFDRIRINIDKIFQDLEMLIKFDKVDADGNVFFKNKKEEVFSIENISTGEKTLLSKVLYLYLKEIKGSVILIDEPELSLHPAWQNRVLKLYETFAKENNCQIIIATHSPHILGSAKNEWIRILRMNENDNVEVINDVLAYGRDIEWVLEEVMGAKSTREESISQKIKECQELLNEDKYDEAEICIDNLEKVIGENDSEVLAMRNSLEFWRE